MTRIWLDDFHDAQRQLAVFRRRGNLRMLARLSGHAMRRAERAGSPAERAAWERIAQAAGMAVERATGGRHLGPLYERPDYDPMSPKAEYYPE